MAITTYSELQTAIKTWADREDMSTAQVKDIISLAEARLNRELNAVEADAALTGVVEDRQINLASLNLIRVFSMYLLDGTEEIRLVPKTAGTFEYTTSPSTPKIWSWDDGYIAFDCPCDRAYNFRIRYIGKFGLSDAATTNALLTNHPDIYLAACLCWTGLFTEDDRKIGVWRALLDGFMEEHKNFQSKRRRSVLQVDPMFLGTNRYGVTSSGAEISYVGYGDDVVYYEGD
jgi:hypothetical protein